MIIIIIIRIELTSAISGTACLLRQSGLTLEAFSWNAETAWLHHCLVTGGLVAVGCQSRISLVVSGRCRREVGHVVAVIY